MLPATTHVMERMQNIDLFTLRELIAVGLVTKESAAHAMGISQEQLFDRLKEALLRRVEEREHDNAVRSKLMPERG